MTIYYVKLEPFFGKEHCAEKCNYNNARKSYTC